MEYSPQGAIPYVSRVDAGTIELVRAQGVDVVSSGDLMQQFEAHWSDAGDRVAQAGGREALSRQGSRVRGGGPAAARRRADNRVRSAAADVAVVCRGRADQRFGAQRVGAGERRQPALPARREQRSRADRPDELLLLDLWGKLDTPGAVFADITWVGFTGTQVPDEMAQAFAAVRDARDAAVSVVEDAARAGREVRGFEVDRAARAVIEAAGYGALHPAPHRPQPRRNRARQRRAPGRLRNARRTPAACPAPASRSSRASISNASACGRKSTWSGARRGPEVTGPRQQEIVALV